MNFSFDSFLDRNFTYHNETEPHTCLWLRSKDMDIGGGIISINDIDVLKQHPETDVVMISGLRQDTFEYFIQTYGKQIKAIKFFKNKYIEDLSPLGTLPQLEYVHFFFNQRITSLWDMKNNTSLYGLCIEDFSRLSTISGINSAPLLKDFRVGNAVWDKMILENLMPLANSSIENFTFYGKSVKNKNCSFLYDTPNLKTFNFPTNMFTTEEVAWIVANFPNLQGYSLSAKRDCAILDSSNTEVPGTIIIGKKKPSLIIKENEKRIEKYILQFEFLKKKYKGVPYTTAFPE